MSKELVDKLNNFVKGKHPGSVGIELERCEADIVTGGFTVTEHVVAGTGFLWAPVVITLADWLCAAAMSANLDNNVSFTTVELKTNFLGSATKGQRVTGIATPKHKGRTTQVWDVEVSNEDSGKVIALFRCTQMLLYPS